MQPPEISEKTDLTLEQAKQEYRDLIEARDIKRPKYGWSSWVVNKIEARLNYLKDVIVDYVMEKSNGK